MKANELRIGDLVATDGLSSVRVVEIGSNYIISERHGKLCDYMTDEIKPIPLTEEWLLRMGFEKHILDGRRCYSLQYDDRETLDIYEANGFFYFLHSGLTAVFIKSLHHLQNLYHIVTRKELTIKEQ